MAKMLTYKTRIANKMVYTRPNTTFLLLWIYTVVLPMYPHDGDSIALDVG